jgi:hypothetical protein
MTDHPTTVNNASPKELAKKVSNLRYDAMLDFLHELRVQLLVDAAKDGDKGYEQLAEHGRTASLGLIQAEIAVKKMWNISRPYMVDKE